MSESPLIGDNVDVQKLWTAVENWQNRATVSISARTPETTKSLSEYLITDLGFSITAP